ncbi:prominin-like protein [Cimex lectularius]|uniref:Prominin-like protein n=1 Tax=Cimex lectularius TaxID=79782 RepID=A0A8I6S348_CIMLE|nr:prominin-like protein [Cimex lectularius]
MGRYLSLFVVCLVLGERSVSSESYGGDTLVLPSPEQNVMPFDPVHYSPANISNNYKSSMKINSRGMGHLYFITKKFMDFILEGEAFPPGFITLEQNKLHISRDYYSLVVHYCWLLLVCLAAGCLAVVVPVIGLLFCCCRLAGRCGARTKPFDKKYDTCRRHFYAFLLSSVTVLIMFGVVCAVVTNEYMEEGAQNLPKTVRVSIMDTKLYLNNTRREVNTLLVTNFGELDVVLNKLLRKSGEIVKNKLGEISKAAVLTNLTTIVQGLKNIRIDLDNMDYLTKSLKAKATELEIVLRNVRSNLLSRLRMCRSERACIDFLNKYNLTALTLEANFTQLPNVTLSLVNVSNILATDIEDEVIKGRDEFDRIKVSIQKSVDRTIPDISKEITKAGEILKRNADKVISVLDKLEANFGNINYRAIDEGEKVVMQYAEYRYYSGLGVSSVLVAILFFLGIGLLCGYCGHRPDASYSDDSCDKGTASSCLMIAVWIMFLSFTAFVAVTLVYMITGSILDRAVCRALHNPSNDSTFNILDQAVDFSSIYESTHGRRVLNISTVIRECHKNSSIYKVLDLDSGSMLQYTQQFNLPEKVRQLSDSIVLGSDIVIITPTAEKQLRALAASPLTTIDLTVYTAVLNDKITSIDLMQLATALNHTAMKLPPQQAEVKTMIQTEALYLEVHQERQVDLMVKLSKQLHGNATLLASHLRFNHSSLKHAVDALLNDLRQAQKTLNSQGPAIVRKLADEFGREFGVHIDSYLSRVDNEAKQNVGRCWPISLVYNATVISVCNNILDPLNGFWLSVGCVVLLFVPAIILSVKLSTLYQKSEPYPGELVEAEYLYDAYAERDNIPLQNINGGGVGGVKKKRRPKKKSGGNAGNRNSSAAYSANLSGRSGAERHCPQAPPDERGNQWEQYNASAPPRYPAISSEYERPPPYYFPGPGQQVPPNP